jgi:hypothetical protein
LHTGECERDGEKLTGLAVHIGARLAALAQPGEVLVSRTVKDLVAGSGIEFDDRGERVLKGVPDEWHLYAVTVVKRRPKAARARCSMSWFSRLEHPLLDPQVARHVPNPAEGVAGSGTRLYFCRRSNPTA